LADALLRLLQNPSLRARMGEAGHRLALENYHVSTVAGRTCDVYQRIAALEQSYV